MISKVNLYEEEIERVVDNLGLNAKWERAAVCYCVSRDSGQPNFLCPTCGGRGYRHLPPQDLKVVVTSLNSQYELNNLELREPGTAYITPTSNVILGYRDRLVFPDFKCTFSEVLQWSKDQDGLGISPRTYRYIKEVIFLADNEYEYEVGVDFEITEDGHHLRWIKDNYIPKLDGRNMSILYYTTPSYLISDLLHELRGTFSDRKSPESTFRELPKQYKIIREDFLYNVSEPEPVQSNSENTPLTYDEDGGITV